MTAMKHILVVAVFLIASVAAAEEFGRVSGGEMKLVPKGNSSFSGSLGVSMSNQSGRGYEGTLGGTLVDDRVWFFAAGQHQERRIFTGFEDLGFPQQTVSNTFDTKLVANIGDRQNLAASFNMGTQPLIPSNFLSLRYTGVISSNMFVNVSVSRLSTD
jgi:hypothetical protein